MHQEVEEGVHEQQRNEQYDECVLRDSIGWFGIGRNGLNDGNYQTVGTYIAEMVVHGYQGDHYQSETSGPFKKYKKHQTAICGGGNNGVELRSRRCRCTGGEAEQDDEQGEDVGQGEKGVCSGDNKVTKGVIGEEEVEHDGEVGGEEERGGGP